MKNIRIRVELDNLKEVQNQVNNLGKNNKLKLDIDTTSINNSLKSLATSIDNVVNKINKTSGKDAFNGLTNSANKTEKELKDIGSTIDNINNKVTKVAIKMDTKGVKTEIIDLENSFAKTSKTVISNSGNMSSSVTVNMKKLESTLSGLQGKLTELSGKGIDISKLQNQFNSFNTNTSEKEINEFANSLKVLESQTTGMESALVKVQQAINNAWNISNKTGNKEIFNTTSFQNAVAQANNIKSALEQVKTTGNAISLDKFNSSITNASSATKGLNDSIKQIDSGYKQVQNSLSTWQEKLNAMKNTKILDESALSKLQNQLNSLATCTSKNDEAFKKFVSSMKEAGTAQSQIKQLESTLNSLNKQINTVKNSKSIIDPTSFSQAQASAKQLEGAIAQIKSTGKTLSFPDLSKSINSGKNSIESLKSSMIQVQTTSTSLGTTLQNSLGKIGMYVSSAMVIRQLWMAFRDGINTTIELDTAMRDLKRVTDETDSTYSKFMATANQTAISLGSTTAGAIEATTTFSQLGYSFEEASEYMSKMAMILSNVGDMSASDSASSLVSILKGFRLEAEETTRIVDVLNEAGNRFALTTGDLTEGLRIGGASLATTNNSLEESSALIISGTEILRNSNLVANGLNVSPCKIDTNTRRKSRDG